LTKFPAAFKNRQTLLTTEKVIDGAQHLMLHLVKPVVNQSFDGLPVCVSIIFSCIKPIQPGEGYARLFKYIDCEKSALTDSDKAAILESWKLLWIERNNSLHAADERCGPSALWLSK
jgi:hypothetical protein